MSKQIQVPQKLLVDVYKLIYALEDYQLDEATQSIVNAIEQQIEAKIERMQQREQYTQSLHNRGT